MADGMIPGWPMTAWLDWMSNGRGTAPLGGDVSQGFAFAPLISVNGQGDPALERDIVENVATYGAQIGQISEIVLALAAGRDASTLEAVTKLREMVEAIERKKTDYGKTALDRARRALDTLRAHDAAGYDLLVASLHPKD